MDRLYQPKRINELLNKYGFKFSKSLGQNFLTDGNIVRKIVDSSETSSDDFVLEIGPGIGTLTEELALRAKKVIAVEIDKKLKPLLEETMQFDNVEILFDDILKIDLNKVIHEKFGNEKFKVVANLPYYITTPIIVKLIESGLNISRITIMVQKEVAKRFAAKTLTKDYGSLSVFMQYYSDISYEFTVPKTVFMPKPRIDSGVINLKMKDELIDIDKDKFFKIVRAAFSKRRKTILNSLSSSDFNLSKEQIKEILDKAEIEENRRAESLNLNEYVKLSKSFPEGM